MAILVDLQSVAVHGHERTLFEDVSLTISSGDRIGVVGINGTGKSTLLRVIAGELSPDSGQVLRGRHTQVRLLEQDPALPAGTVREAIGHGWETDSVVDRLSMGAALTTDTDQLSGGQRKRVALIRLFGDPGDVIILDEPTNHLDLVAIEWLENEILRFPGAVIIVSHDRFLLDRVTTRMVEIDRGHVYSHSGGYAQLLENQAEREELVEKTEQTRRNLARRELAWLRRGAKARTSKPQARIDAAERLLAASAPASARDGRLDFITDVPRLGNTVVRAHRVSFAYAHAPATVVDFNIDLGPGDRIGVVGPNGAGKTTLVNLLAQRLSPTAGTIKTGPTVVAAHFEQGDDDLDLEKSVQELVAGPLGQPGSLADQALMKRFWFTGGLQVVRARELSGGERRRLQLLLALAQRPNLLFLDEPTNDLDLETIRFLEDFLAQWPGTLIVVSHDRTFLSQTTDRLLEIRSDGSVLEIPGGIDALIERGFSTSSTPPRATTPGPSRGKRLREAEKEMARLERKRQSLQERIASSSSVEQQSSWSKELQQVIVDLGVAEEIWLHVVEESA